MANLGFYNGIGLKVFEVTIKEGKGKNENGTPKQIAFIDASISFSERKKNDNDPTVWKRLSIKIIIGAHAQREIITAKRMQDILSNGTCKINLMGIIIDFDTTYTNKDGQVINLKHPSITVMCNAIQVVDSTEERSNDKNFTKSVSKPTFKPKKGGFEDEIEHGSLDDEIPF